MYVSIDVSPLSSLFPFAWGGEKATVFSMDVVALLCVVVTPASLNVSLPIYTPARMQPSGLRVATWNVARPGGESNPFALWVQGGNTRSHSMKEGADRELQQRLDLFMLEAQDILDEVARYGFDREMVTVGDVFTEEMFENLERHAIREGLTETGWDRYEKPHDSSTAHTSKPPSPGAPPAWPLDAMRQAYELDLRHRTLTNGFLRDETLHDKRLLVAFDELTAAVPLPTKQTKVKTHGTADMEGGGRNRGFEVNEKAQQETKDARNTENGFRYRPAVTTCHAKPFANTHNGNLTAWFHQWLEFMFEGVFKNARLGLLSVCRLILTFFPLTHFVSPLSFFCVSLFLLMPFFSLSSVYTINLRSSQGRAQSDETPHETI